ncbi:hypothetical protein [Galactobacter caseinivorans]|uniref:Alkaline shock response membrane anchor protein AmaP n=1 Tax=Galactobacter caseinivorans TaxID=2676123 RepID=A0A496PG11_9MICC|nr:hypothetical protein [Galactobacter caseinivorans]RKW69563.1 hypothetical protein DWQ67_12235 [Galactobacter caseinivorans]
MNRTPRGLNRTILAILGVLCVLFGAHLILVSVLPAYASAVAAPLASINTWVTETWGATSTGGGGWVWLALAVPAVLIVVFAVVWMLSQGRGRVTLYSREAVPEGQARGVVEITGSVPTALLKRALADRGDILSVSMSVWDQQADAAGLRVRIQPRPGAEPLRLVQDMDRWVQELDERVGLQGPVLVELVSGTRARFARTERVR